MRVVPGLPTARPGPGHGVEAFIEDLRSRNGTWLRGHRIERAPEIQPRDVVSVGPEEIQFVAPDGQASTTRD